MTIGSPSGIAATASDTVLQRSQHQFPSNDTETKTTFAQSDVPPIVNMSNQERCCKTPMIQMTPMIPNDIMESFLASSSMFSWRGVRFSSTYKPDGIFNNRIYVDVRVEHTSCIIEKMTPNSVSVPVAMTMPEPLPLKYVSSHQ